MNTEIQLFNDSSCSASPTSASADVSDLNLRREDIALQVQINRYLLNKKILDANSTIVVAVQLTKLENFLSKARGGIK